MKATRLVSMLLCAALYGCASEGGVTGTGISASTVAGNVSIVEEPENQAGGAAEVLPFAVRVTIDLVPGIESTTDAEGFFELSGDFSGPLVLLFANADTGAELGPLEVEVPAGSTTVLENIEIRPGDPEPVHPAVMRQFGAFGHVGFVECLSDGKGLLLVDEEGPPGHMRQFRARIVPDTVIAHGDGSLLECEDILRGDAVAIEGVQPLRDGGLVATAIVVSPLRPEPGDRHEVELGGLVLNIDCGRDRLLVRVVTVDEGDAFDQPVRLSPETRIRCQPEHEPCECSDISPGDAVGVRGTVRTDRPGAVFAEGMVVEEQRTIDLFAGVVRTVCAANRILVVDLGVTDLLFQIRFSSATQIVCSEGPCRCSDIRPGDRVDVQGELFVDRLLGVDAELIRVRSSPGLTP